MVLNQYVLHTNLSFYLDTEGKYFCYLGLHWEN